MCACLQYLAKLDGDSNSPTTSDDDNLLVLGESCVDQTIDVVCLLYLARTEIVVGTRY